MIKIPSEEEKLNLSEESLKFLEEEVLKRVKEAPFRFFKKDFKVTSNDDTKEDPSGESSNDTQTNR